MINKLIGIITFLTGLAFYFFKAGKDNAKNKQNEKAISGIKETQKIKKDIASLSRSDKLNRL